MDIAIHEAKGKISALIRAANQGEMVRLTSHGKPVAEIKAIREEKSVASRLAAIQAIQSQVASDQNVTADQADDPLYDEMGLPQSRLPQ